MRILKSVIADLLQARSAGKPGAGNALIEYLERHPKGRLVHRFRHYFDIYHRHFSRFRGERLTVIEIGVFNGGALPMWREYFGGEATIVGIDINPGCAQFAEPGIEIVIGDQGDRSFLRSLASRYSDVAIVIDDGGHRMDQQIATFEELYPRMGRDGVYMCEDISTSYDATFGGGYREPQTFVETTKALVDRLNADHTSDWSVFAPDEFTRTTDSIHFYDNAVVIERKSRKRAEEVVYGSQAPFRYIAPSLSGD